jgi:hypothetical protein
VRTAFLQAVAACDPAADSVQFVCRFGRFDPIDPQRQENKQGPEDQKAIGSEWLQMLALTFLRNVVRELRHEASRDLVWLKPLAFLLTICMLSWNT